MQGGERELILIGFVRQLGGVALLDGLGDDVDPFPFLIREEGECVRE